MKIKHSFIYTEDSDKGLDLLLRIFPVIRSEFKDATLCITSQPTTQQMEIIAKYDYISVGKGDISTFEVWIYPTHSSEVNYDNVMSAQKGGCLCISSYLGELPDLVGFRGVLVNNCNYGSNEYICFIFNTIRVLFKSDLYTNKLKNAIAWAELNGTIEISTHVINLDRQPEKWKSCQEKLKKAGITKYNRFSAIDGEQLEWNDELKKYFKLKDNNYYYIPYQNNVGIFGVAMSHIRLWEKFESDNDNDVWIVMEDDIVFGPSFSKNWAQTYKSIQADKNWDMCYLGFLFFEQPLKTTDIKISENLYRLMKSDERKNVGGFHCYCIRLSGVKKLLEIIRRDKVSRPIDWVPIDNFDTIVSYLVYPTICDQDRSIQSSIQGPQKTLKGLGDYCTVEYQGGLGNQLFQIMTLLAYSIRTNKIPVFQYMDKCICGTRSTHWNSVFKNIKHLCVDNINNVMGTRTIISEPRFNTYFNIPNIKGNVSIRGFFQCYKFFDDIKDTLYKTLGFDVIIENIKIKYQDILSVPNDTKLVSVHFRLGDYRIRSFIQPSEYYIKSLLEIIKPDQKYKILYFCENEDNECIINDYISKFDCKDLFVKVSDTISDIDQMFIMSQCDISVIGNSSFSWWGAYLGKKKEIVKYPTVWTNQDNVTDDMIPEYWR